MTILMKDDMIKESKRWKIPMILFFALSALFPFALIWNDMKTSEFIAGEIFFILMGCYFLYGYSYTYQYKVIVTNEKIVLKTLFKNTEIELKDIKTYHCKRYGKSEFYQFSILGKDKKILIHTRYQDDFEKLLKENKTILE